MLNQETNKEKLQEVSADVLNFPEMEGVEGGKIDGGCQITNGKCAGEKAGCGLCNGKCNVPVELPGPQD